MNAITERGGYYGEKEKDEFYRLFLFNKSSLSSKVRANYNTHKHAPGFLWLGEAGLTSAHLPLQNVGDKSLSGFVQ